MKQIDIPEGITGKELHDFLVANKSTLIAQKKYNVKHADGVIMSGMYVNDKGIIVKAEAPISQEDLSYIDRTLIINTTNLFDSHGDVHFPGLWNKSLKENKNLFHLQEHIMSFQNIITGSNNIKAYTKNFSWADLGYSASGITEALVFDVRIERARNPYMFEQYKNGWVTNHSVGMRYVTIELAINNSDYKEEFAVWNKYIDQIVNKKDVEENGYFWAVTQAKVVEGSAVPIGSNFVTPTLNSQKEVGTVEQPVKTTVEQPQFDLKKAIKETQFITS